MEFPSLDANPSKHEVVEESYELVPIESFSIKSDGGGETIPQSGTNIPVQMATSHIPDHMDNEGEEPEHHLSAMCTAKIQPHTPITNGGQPTSLPPGDQLTGTLVHSCLGCIVHLRSIEGKLNKRNYDTFRLFDDQSYAIDIEIQLKEDQQNIPISFIGRHNAGKSALINAILGDELLPQRVMNETGIRVYIQDNPDYHRGPCLDPSGKCSKCPVLVPFPKGTDVSGGSQRYQGKKEIKCALRSLNKKSRSSSKEEIGDRLLLVNVPILRDAASITSGQQVYLVDTPGIGDSSKSISELAEKSAMTSPAYVYVMSYLCLEDDTDSRTIERMYGKDTKLLESNRLAIAVTQYDRFFQDASHDESDDDDTALNDEAMQVYVKCRVCKQLENKLEVPIPHNLIFLVSGMWGLKARNKRDSQQFVKYLESYSKKVTSTYSIEAPSDDAAQRLLAASGVGLLERSIEEIVRNCYASWVQNMKGNCLSFLRHAMSEIQKAKCKHSGVYDVWKAQSDAEYALCVNVLQAKDALSRTLSTTDPVYHYLKGSCRDEFNAKVLDDVHEQIGTQTNSLQSRCNEKVGKKYTPDVFEKDLSEFLEDFSRSLEKRFSNVSLEMVFSCHHRIDRDMKEQYAKMVEDTHLLCHGSIHSHPTDQGQSPPGSYSSERSQSHKIMEDSRRETPLKLPELLDEIVVKPFKGSKARHVQWTLRALWQLVRHKEPSERLWREWNSYYNEFRFLKRRMSSSQSNDGDQSEDQPVGTTDPEMGIDTPAPRMQRCYSQPIEEDLLEDQQDTASTSEAESIASSEMDIIVTLPRRMLSKEQVTNAVEQLKTLIHTELQKYAETLAEKVAQHFFKRYQIACRKNLGDFNDVMWPKLQAVQEKLEKEKEEKKKLLEYIKELEENCKQLMAIKQDIHTKADEALRHL